MSDYSPNRLTVEEKFGNNEKETMSRPKARGDVELKKAKARIEELIAESNQSSMGILNMRMMYEAATQEKLSLQANIDNMQNLITGMLHQQIGQRMTLTEETFPHISDYVGIDTEAIDGELIIKLIHHEEEE